MRCGQVVFLLDAYDEMRPEDLWRNLYKSNGLEQYRPRGSPHPSAQEASAAEALKARSPVPPSKSSGPAAKRTPSKPSGTKPAPSPRATKGLARTPGSGMLASPPPSPPEAYGRAAHQRRGQAAAAPPSPLFAALPPPPLSPPPSPPATDLCWGASAAPSPPPSPPPAIPSFKPKADAVPEFNPRLAPGKGKKSDGSFAIPEFRKKDVGIPDYEAIAKKESAYMDDWEDEFEDPNPVVKQNKFAGKFAEEIAHKKEAEAEAAAAEKQRKDDLKKAHAASLRALRPGADGGQVESKKKEEEAAATEAAAAKEAAAKLAAAKEAAAAKAAAAAATGDGERDPSFADMDAEMEALEAKHRAAKEALEARRAKGTVSQVEDAPFPEPSAEQRLSESTADSAAPPAADGSKLEATPMISAGNGERTAAELALERGDFSAAASLLALQAELADTTEDKIMCTPRPNLGITVPH